MNFVSKIKNKRTNLGYIIDTMWENWMWLIPSLCNHLLPILVERIQGVISSPSDQPNTLISDPSSRGPIVSPFTNIDANDNSSSLGH